MTFSVRDARRTGYCVMPKYVTDPASAVWLRSADGAGTLMEGDLIQHDLRKKSGDDAPEGGAEAQQAHPRRGGQERESMFSGALLRAPRRRDWRCGVGGGNGLKKWPAGRHTQFALPESRS